MSHPYLVVFLAFISSANLAAQASGETAASRPSVRSEKTSVPSQAPNFVFILGEGQGWSSTSVPMGDGASELARAKGLTPNLEKLAAEGTRLAEFYVGCPRCTPSRASFFTGISPAKLKMTYGNDGGKEDRLRGVTSSVERLATPEPLRELPSSVDTVAELLKKAGYGTAHFGKWHIGRASPKVHGFDETDGPNTNAGPGDNRTPNPGEAAAITDRGIAFMKREVAAKRPFYLQLSHYGGGTEGEATPAALARVDRLLPNARAKERFTAAVLVDMDDAIGRVLDALVEMGIADRTYVVFSTDHGSPGGGARRAGPGANAPLYGGKGSVREGGIRVPFIVRGPGVAAGAIARTRAIGWDLCPTFLELAGIKNIPSEIEGGSLAPVLFKKSQATVRRPREEIVVHFPHYDLENGGPASAIFLGDRKLVKNYDTKKIGLFDVVKDPGETNDLSLAEPERAAELEKRLAAYLEAIDAQMPSERSATGGESPKPPAEDEKNKPREGRRKKD